MRLKRIKDELKKEFYSMRAVTYALVIISSLLFLLNLKTINLELSYYLFFLSIVVIAILTEFLFSLNYSSLIYHKSHPLRSLYKTVKIKHLYNIILLPIVQYVACALIIFYSVDVLIALFSIFITTIFTYFTFVSYSKLYENNLKISYQIEEFFDASKYVSFAFISYLLLVLYIQFLIPRSFVAVIIGVVQFIYILSAIWRRNKISFLHVGLSFISSLLITAFVYWHLVNVPLLNEIGLIEISTAHVLLFDYVISSLILRWVDNKFSYTALLEYILIVLISISLLVFSF